MYFFCMSTYVYTILQVDNSLGPPRVKFRKGRAILLTVADPLLSRPSLLNINFKKIWKMNIKFAKNLQFLEIIFS